MPSLRGATLALIAPALIGGCASSPFPLTQIGPIRLATGMADAQVAARYIRTPRPGRFSVCHEHTCHAISEINFTADEWAGVRQGFAVPATDAVAERELIAIAVATLEQLVGVRIGTANDQGRNFPGLGLSGQMDCVDEATNTSAYLIMLQQDGLLYWHQAGPRLSRGVERLQALHFTATLDETATGTRFAVDSWFEANGRPPHIVPIADWSRGWRPPGNTAQSGRNSGRD